MGKLQQITRIDGSIISSINIPRGIINELDWNKGDPLIVEIGKVRVNSIVIYMDEVNRLNEQLNKEKGDGTSKSGAD